MIPIFGSVDGNYSTGADTKGGLGDLILHSQPSGMALLHSGGGGMHVMGFMSVGMGVGINCGCSGAGIGVNHGCTGTGTGRGGVRQSNKVGLMPIGSDLMVGAELQRLL